MKEKTSSSEAGKKSRMDRKQLWLVFAIIVAAGSVVAMVYASTPPQAKTGGTLDERFKALMEKSATMTERPKYFSDYIQQVMFGELDKVYPFPEDFYEKRIMYQYNVRDYDQDFYTSDYTMQPEWVYTDMEPYDRIVDYINRWNPQSSQIWGLGLYPKYYKMTINGDEAHSMDFDFWLTSVPVTESYNGVHAEVSYPQIVSMSSVDEFEIPSDFIAQDPSETKKYFSATVTPENFVLAPNFPVYRVDGDITYRQRVTLTIVSKAGTPKGRYAVGVSSMPPDDEYNQEQISIFGLDYKPTRGALTQGSKEFRVLIDVI